MIGWSTSFYQQLDVDLIESAQTDGQRSFLRCIVDRGLRFCVGEGSPRSDHALGETRAHDLSVGRHIPDAREGEPVHVGAQRAQVALVREAAATAATEESQHVQPADSTAAVAAADGLAFEDEFEAESAAAVADPGRQLVERNNIMVS